MTELAVPFVAGLFGLIPLMWQITSTRAQRQDRLTRLNHLRAELELLERLSTLQGRVSVGDEAAKHQIDVTIDNALGNVMGQYNRLSEIAPSKVAPATVGGAKQPAPRQLSFLRRALLLYDPNTALGWLLHTVFYVVGIIFLVFLPLLFLPPYDPIGLLFSAFFATPFLAVLLIIQRLARRRAAPQLEETAS
jgi:hypothetical protein